MGLMICIGEIELYSLELLMRALTERLGILLDNQLIVTMKRLDACKTTTTSADWSLGGERMAAVQEKGE